jgi:hypothetical protein
MRDTPSEFTKGPKGAVGKLNQLIRAVDANKVIPGLGLRIRETENGILLTLDDRILRVSGLANQDQLGRAPGDGRNPYGSGNNRINEPEKPAIENPKTEDDDQSGGSETGGSGGGGFEITPVEASRLRITTLSLPTAVLNEPYQATISAAGGRPNKTWTVEGDLPTGFDQNLSGSGFFIFDNRVNISGTPTELEEKTFRVTVTDGVDTVSAEYTLVVVGIGELRIIAPTDVTAYWFEEMSPISISVAGGVEPYWLRQTGGNWGSLFQYISLSDSTAQIVSRGAVTFPGSNLGPIANQTWNQYLGYKMFHGEISYNEIWPFRLDVGVTDFLGTFRFLSVNINVSIDLSRYCIVQFSQQILLRQYQWVLRTEAQANGWNIVF